MFGSLVSGRSGALLRIDKGVTSVLTSNYCAQIR
jgi:hypothetical protein